jgi:hypothetical protein
MKMKMKRAISIILFACGLMLHFYPGLAQSTEENYIKSYVARSEQNGDLSVVNDETLVRESIEYYDGLGRLYQSIIRKNNAINGTYYDFISPQIYDAYSRNTSQLLPYVSQSQDGSFDPQFLVHQQEFYDNHFANGTGNYAKSKSVLESSELSRQLENYSPGQDWQNKPVSFYSGTNQTSDQVLIWIQEDNQNAPFIFDYYANDQLSKMVTTDENGRAIMEFTDKIGQTILKRVQVVENVDLNNYDPSHWAETYYVYDDYGNLRTVLPPKLVNDISSSIEAGFVIPATELEGLAFQYEYDGRNRMTRKKVPGADWVEMIYDDRDRLALTQDGEQAEEGKWMFTKYDALNRPVMTGKVSYNNRTAAEQALNTFYSGVENTGSKYYESRSSTGTQGYDNTSFPELTLNDEVHTVTYYDDYDVLNESHFNSVAPSADDFDYETGITGYTDNDADLWTSMKGQVTATKTLLYDIGAGDQYIHTVTYYDWKYRPIQIRSTNQFGGLNVVHNLYDFVGNLTHSREVYSVDAGGNEQYVINKEYIYDHADRLLEVYHQIGDDANNRVLVLQNKYNELGELIEKNLHAGNVNEPDNTNYLQSLDYRYNIRGWLQSINTPTTRPDATINPDDNSQIDDAFGMELLYTNPTLND